MSHKNHRSTAHDTEYHEACEEILSLNEQLRRLETENEYLHSFINYKGLTDSYEYFRMNAHMEEDEDLPFGHYTL